MVRPNPETVAFYIFLLAMLFLNFNWFIGQETFFSFKESLWISLILSVGMFIWMKSAERKEK